MKDKKPVIKQICPKCGKTMKHIGTGHFFKVYRCSDCKTQVQK